jgi:hypothetical protein
MIDLKYSVTFVFYDFSLSIRFLFQFQFIISFLDFSLKVSKRMIIDRDSGNYCLDYCAYFYCSWTLIYRKDTF